MNWREPKIASFKFSFGGKDEQGWVVIIPQAFGIQTSVTWFAENTMTFVVTGGHKLNTMTIKAVCDSPITAISSVSEDEHWASIPGYVREAARDCYRNLIK